MCRGLPDIYHLYPFKFNILKIILNLYLVHGLLNSYFSQLLSLYLLIQALPSCLYLVIICFHAPCFVSCLPSQFIVSHLGQNLLFVLISILTLLRMGQDHLKMYYFGLIFFFCFKLNWLLEAFMMVVIVHCCFIQNLFETNPCLPLQSV